MDYYQLGKTALEARQFFEAENHFRRALKQVSEDRLESIYESIYEIAKSLRPETAWKEFQIWMREKAKKKNWKELLEVLLKYEDSIPKEHWGCIYELKAEIFFNLGNYGKARISSAEHLEYLLKKKITPSYLLFSEKYNGLFPHTLIFYFHSVVASCQVQDVGQVEKKIKSLFELINQRWNQLEDITPASKVTVLEEICISLDNLDRKNGESVLLLHYCQLELLRETKVALKPEDWKKLVELLIYKNTWRHLKLGLQLAILSKDEMLLAELHSQVLTKKSFSFVKFTKNDPQMKRWLLKRGHSKEKEILMVKEDEARDAIDDFEEQSDLERPKVDDHSQTEELNEEEKIAEKNAIKQLSIISPPLDLIPDLIITYEMLGFGKVVDWLIENYRDCEDFPRLQRKIQYLSVMRDIKKKSYHYALATLEEMLGSKDVSLDELKELKYAQGAIYKALGDQDKSSSAFREVEKIHPGYRKIRERNQ